MRLLMLVLAARASVPPITYGSFFYFPEDYVEYNVRDLKVVFEQTFRYTLNLKPGSLRFNLFDFLNVPQVCQRFFARAQAFFIADDKSFCVKLLSENRGENLYDVNSKEAPDQGFWMSMRPDEIKWVAICDPTVDVPKYQLLDKNVVVKSRNSCGNINVLFKILDRSRLLFSLMMVAVGALLFCLGGYQWRVFFAVFTALFVFFFVLFVLVVFATFITGEVVLLFEVNFCLMVGVSLGYLAYKSADKSYPYAGFLGGLFLSFLLLERVFLLGDGMKTKLLEMLCCVGFSVLFYKLGRRSMIAATSVIGSFLVCYYLGYAFHWVEGLWQSWNTKQWKMAQVVLAIISLILSPIGIVIQDRLIHRDSKVEQEILRETLVSDPIETHPTAAS